MTVAARRASMSLRPSLVVARFTLLSIVRRRWLAFAGGIGLLMLAIDGIYTKSNDHAAPNSYLALIPHRLADQVFRSSAALTAVIVGGLTIVVAMSIIRDDLGSGAAELLLTKPLPRSRYAFGKVATLAVTAAVIAAVIALVRIGVLLIAMNDSAYVADSAVDTLAIAANAFVLGLVVLAVSSWGSSLAAGLLAAILLLIGTVTAPMMQDVGRNQIVGSQAQLVAIAYYASPRMLSTARNSYSADIGTRCTTAPSGRSICIDYATPRLTSFGGSSFVDVIALAGYGAGTIVILVLGIRRFSGRLTE
jgi:hypothetical protein